MAGAGLALGLTGTAVGMRAMAQPAEAPVAAKPKRALKIEAHAGATDAGVAAATTDAATPDAGVGAGVDAGVDAGVEARPEEPPLDEEKLRNELPPGDQAPPAAMATLSAGGEAQLATASGMRPYGRQDPLMRNVRLDGHVALTWDGSFGVGVRADWLLIAGTFKYSSRDELALSAGADVTFLSFDGSHVVEVYPTAVLQWSIGVNDRLFFYPEVGFVGHVDDGKWDGLFPNIGFGTRYYLARSIGLQARFGWPMALTLGAVF